MENNVNKPHKISVDNRKKMTLTGVSDVVSFDLKHVLLKTSMGMLEVKGNDIKVTKVSLESGELNVNGTIDSLEYSNVKDHGGKSKSMIKRMFR